MKPCAERTKVTVVATDKSLLFASIEPLELGISLAPPVHSAGRRKRHFLLQRRCRDSEKAKSSTWAGTMANITPGRDGEQPWDKD